MLRTVVCLSLVFAAAGTFAASTCQAQPAGRARQKGDHLVTLYRDTPVRDEDRPLATLDAGVELVAKDVQDNWILVAVDQGGRQVQGWVYGEHVSGDVLQRGWRELTALGGTVTTDSSGDVIIVGGTTNGPSGSGGRAQCTLVATGNILSGETALQIATNGGAFFGKGVHSRQRNGTVEILVNGVGVHSIVCDTQGQFDDFWPQSAPAGSPFYGADRVNLADLGIKGPLLTVTIVASPNTAIDISELSLVPAAGAVAPLVVPPMAVPAAPSMPAPPESPRSESLPKSAAADDDEVGPRFVLYDEGHKADFIPSGWMPDGRGLAQDVRCTDSPHSGKYCVRTKYRPSDAGNPKRIQHWAGIAWLLDGQWEPRRRYDLYPRLGAQRGEPIVLRFWARSKQGAQIEFSVGGGREDSIVPIHLPPWSGAKLDPQWKRFQIDLTDADLSQAVQVFASTARPDSAPEMAAVLEELRSPPSHRPPLPCEQWSQRLDRVLRQLVIEWDLDDIYIVRVRQRPPVPKEDALLSIPPKSRYKPIPAPAPPPPPPAPLRSPSKPIP